MSNETILDVREIPLRERHPKIFDTFDHLTLNSSFILQNDHDPKPLYYQFTFERSEQFAWIYLEEGPEVWKVRITKTANQKSAQDSQQKAHGHRGGCCGT